MPGKIPPRPDDFTAIIAKLERRIRALETSPRTQFPAPAIANGKVVFGDPAGKRIELRADQETDIVEMILFTGPDDADGASLGHGNDPAGEPYDLILTRGSAAVGFAGGAVSLNAYDLANDIATSQVEVFKTGVNISALSDTGEVQVSASQGVLIYGNTAWVLGIDTGSPGFFEDGSGNLLYRTHSGNVRTVAAA